MSEKKEQCPLCDDVVYGRPRGASAYLCARGHEFTPETTEQAYARGVAEERARCRRLVIYEGHSHGAGDDGPEDRAQSMSDSIVKAIDGGGPASDWLT